MRVKHTVDPVKSLTEFNILLLKPVAFLPEVVPLRDDCRKLLTKGANLLVKLPNLGPSIITLRGSNPMGLPLIVTVMLEGLDMSITLDQGISQALNNITLTIQSFLSTLKHILDISVTAISLAKLMPQALVIGFQTTNPVIEFVNLTLQPFHPISLSGQGCNIVDNRLEELFHLLLRRHCEGSYTVFQGSRVVPKHHPIGSLVRH